MFRPHYLRAVSTRYIAEVAVALSPGIFAQETAGKGLTLAGSHQNLRGHFGDCAGLLFQIELAAVLE